MRPSIRFALLPMLGALACGAPPMAPLQAAPPGRNGHPLYGAWTTSTLPSGRALPCPFILELFEDGTAESNLLSDDDDASMCSFARLPAQHDPSRTPAVLALAGQLASCIYRREGPNLLLACEDHRDRPPPDFREALVLERLDVREGSGLASLAGTWSGPRLWGPAATMTISSNGRVVGMGEGEAKIVVKDARRLELTLRDATQRCRYRVTERRLALRCAEVGLPWPEDFGHDRTLMETLVFRRATPELDAALGARPPPTRPELGSGSADGGDDRDGDGRVDRLDECPDETEDYDAFEDEDGCPEHDNDQDGTLDVDDHCPNEPEDRDGWQDEDGCPDPDNDADRILDVDDRCPNDPETYNGRGDTDGCPDR